MHDISTQKGRLVDGVARIDWASGWLGILRRTPRGGYQLLTWKANTPRQARPNDTQPATRISP